MSDAKTGTKTLRIRHGAGRVRELEIGEASPELSVRHNLQNLVSQQIQDKDLRESLLNQKLTLDVFTEREEGPLDPEAAWQEVSHYFEDEEAAEVGIGQRARGGAQ